MSSCMQMVESLGGFEPAATLQFRDAVLCLFAHSGHF